MPWNVFHPREEAYVYTPASLKKAWTRLHAGDAEPFPADAALVAAWIAYHAGDFEQAASLGLAHGLAGYAVAHKATCVYATYLETDDQQKLALFEAVAERCERQQIEQPDNPAGFFWHAYALGRHAQGMSVVKALAQGWGGKVRHSLDRTLKLAPQHADAHTAFGAFNAEIIDKIGEMMAALTYGVRKEEGFKHFKTALALHPDSAIARIEHAKALVMLDGNKKMAEALALYESAADCQPRDATERLDVDAAKEELED